MTDLDLVKVGAFEGFGNQADDDRAVVAVDVGNGQTGPVERDETLVREVAHPRIGHARRDA